MGLLSRYEPHNRTEAVALVGRTLSKLYRLLSSEARMWVNAVKSELLI
jgi:hypothetical protein